MDFINRILSEELVYALGWTVVHSLWQSLGVALLLAGALLVLQKQTAKTRYRVAYLALLIALGLSVATFVRLYQFGSLEKTTEITLLTTPADPQETVASSESFGTQPLLQRFANYFQAHMPLIVSVWLLGMAFFTLRLLGGLSYVQYLKTSHVFPTDKKWQLLLQQLAKRIPLHRPVQLMESALVKVPMVIGHLKPVILMPVGVVNALSPDQVEAIVAHELAHIARQDYLLNVLQSVIEVLFYFNPAIWWISVNIRTERENCCDDLAVVLCGNSLNYAKALLAIQEMSQAAPVFAMAFAGKKNQLLFRIQRILNQSQNKPDIMEKITATFLLLAALIGLTISATSPYHNKEAFKTLEVPALLAALTDTLPQKGTMNFTGRHNGQDVKTTVKNGKITYLKIEGKEIPESEYKQYVPLVEEIMENVPPPPPPPPAPMPPAAVRPMTPPAPPAPPAGNWEWQNGTEGQLQELSFLESMNHNLLDHQRLIEAQEKELKALTESLLQEQNGAMELHEKTLREELARLRAEEMHLREEQTMHKREMERFALEQQKFEAERLAWEKRNNEARTRLEQALVKDELIKSGAGFHLILNSEVMTLNGAKVSDALAKKYRNIYKELWGKDLCEGCNFSINTRGREE